MKKLKNVLPIIAIFSIFISCKRDHDFVSPLIGTWDARKLIISNCINPTENAEYTCAGGGCEFVIFTNVNVNLFGEVHSYTIVGDKIHVELSPSLILVMQFKIDGSVLTLTIQDGEADGGCKYEYTYLKG
jgi:hypothetical protein